MKILYVEDDIVQICLTIRRLFSGYLNTEIFDALKQVNSSYPEFDEIKRIIESTGFIEIECRFPDALAKILRYSEKYALFIVDRDLSNYPYTYDEIRSIDPTYKKNDHRKYLKGTQGDYLFITLKLAGIDVRECFYFLTAHPKTSQEVKLFIDREHFTEKQVIEKNNPKDIEWLQQAITNVKRVKLKSENSGCCEILKNADIDEDNNENNQDRFLDILEMADDPNSFVEENLQNIHAFYEEVLLNKILHRIPCPQASRRRELPLHLSRNIKEFLKSLPIMESGCSGQSTLIQSACLDPCLVGMIKTDSICAVFVESLVFILNSYGTLEDKRDALEAILEASKNYVGAGRRECCDTLIRECCNLRKQTALPEPLQGEFDRLKGRLSPLCNMNELIKQKPTLADVQGYVHDLKLLVLFFGKICQLYPLSS